MNKYSPYVKTVEEQRDNCLKVIREHEQLIKTLRATSLSRS